MYKSSRNEFSVQPFRNASLPKDVEPYIAPEQAARKRTNIQF